MVSDDKIKRYIKIAIDNVIKEGTTDIDLFSRPFELGYLKSEPVRNKLQNLILERIKKNTFDELKVHKLSHVLVPKKDLCDFRKCALIDIIDEIMYLTLVLIVAKPIEVERINRSKNRVFSYRYEPKKGYLFDPKYHFTSFRFEIMSKSKKRTNNVIVECDISNFYDRLNIHRIESALMSFERADNDIVCLINELLLFWANRDSYGLPVGSNASRILAEAALVNVDRFLVSHGVDFCRFVDDYRIFAKDAETAHKHLALLSHCLSREGLFINTAKTRVRDISQQSEEDVSGEDLHEVNEQREDPATEIAQGVDVLTEDKVTPKIIRGYNGLIPTKYRELTRNECNSLKDDNLEAFIDEITCQPLVKEDEVKRVIKTIDAKKAYHNVTCMPSILRKFPQFIPYFVDFINKKKDVIPVKKVDELILSFAELFNQEDIPEYILVYLVRLVKIGSIGKNQLLEIFRNLKRGSGVYIGRELLESFNGVISRTEVLEIKETFIRSDDWEKRQILRLVANYMPAPEKRPFFKDTRNHFYDFFVEWITSFDEDMQSITNI